MYGILVPFLEICGLALLFLSYSFMYSFFVIITSKAFPYKELRKVLAEPGKVLFVSKHQWVTFF